MKKRLLLLASLILAIISIGIITLFLMVYASWIDGSATSVFFPGLGLIVSSSVFLVILLVIEIFISTVLFVIVRQFRKR